MNASAANPLHPPPSEGFDLDAARFEAVDAVVGAAAMETVRVAKSEPSEEDLVNQMQAMVDAADLENDAVFESPAELLAAEAVVVDSSVTERATANIRDLDAALGQAGLDELDGSFETVGDVIQPRSARMTQPAETSRPNHDGLTAGWDEVEGDFESVEQACQEAAVPGEATRETTSEGFEPDPVGISGEIDDFDAPDAVLIGSIGGDEAGRAGGGGGFEPDPTDVVPVTDPPVIAKVPGRAEQSNAEGSRQALKKPAAIAAPHPARAGPGVRVITLRVPTFPSLSRAVKPLGKRGLDLTLWACGMMNQPARRLKPELQQSLGWGALAIAIPGGLVLAYGLIF